MALIDLSSLPVLSSKRLLLRQPRHADVDAIRTLANNWEVARWMGRLPFPYQRNDAILFLEQIVPREAVWIVQDHDSATVFGVGGLTPHEALGKVELGYWLGEEYWGNGFATEAIRAILGYAFGPASLPKVISGCFVDNKRSAHVLEKLGFHTVGTSMRSCMAQAKDLPYLDMALTREVWASAVGDALRRPSIPDRCSGLD